MKPFGSSRPLRIGAPFLVVLGALMVVNCGSVGNAPATFGTSPIPAPTPIVVPSTPPDTEVAQVLVNLPAATADATPEPVALPTAAGFASTMFLPLPETATSSQLTLTISNVALSSSPPLSRERFAEALRFPEALPAGAAVLLYGLIFSPVTLTLPEAPGFTILIPSADVFPNANYYLAWYDPTRPSLGWQYDFEGPATVTGRSLTFAPNPAPLRLEGGLLYNFLLYAIPRSSTQPTPAPSITPTSVPTQLPPTLPPSPAPTPSGAIAISLTVPTPGPIVCTPATLTVAVGSTLPVGCSEMSYAGSFHPTLDNPGIASVIIPTPFPAPSSTPTSTHSPTPSPTSSPTGSPTPGASPTPTLPPAVFLFSITGVHSGSTTLRLTSDNGSVAALALTVTP